MSSRIGSERVGLKFEFKYPHKCDKCPKIINSIQEEHKHMNKHIRKTKGGKK